VVSRLLPGWLRPNGRGSQIQWHKRIGIVDIARNQALTTQLRDRHDPVRSDGHKPHALRL
jgi:hypothetical protein